MKTKKAITKKAKAEAEEIAILSNPTERKQFTVEEKKAWFQDNFKVVMTGPFTMPATEDKPEKKYFKVFLGKKTDTGNFSNPSKIYNPSEYEKAVQLAEKIAADRGVQFHNLAEMTE
jgi:hypothetical protein